MLAAWVALTHMPRCSDCAGRDCALVWCACTERANKYAYMHACKVLLFQCVLHSCNAGSLCATLLMIVAAQPITSVQLILGCATGFPGQGVLTAFHVAEAVHWR